MLRVVFRYASQRVRHVCFRHCRYLRHYVTALCFSLLRHYTLCLSLLDIRDKTLTPCRAADVIVVSRAYAMLFVYLRRHAANCQLFQLRHAIRFIYALVFHAVVKMPTFHAIYRPTMMIR